MGITLSGNYLVSTMGAQRSFCHNGAVRDQPLLYATVQFHDSPRTWGGCFRFLSTAFSTKTDARFRVVHSCLMRLVFMFHLFIMLINYLQHPPPLPVQRSPIYPPCIPRLPMPPTPLQLHSLPQVSRHPPRARAHCAFDSARSKTASLRGFWCRGLETGAWKWEGWVDSVPLYFGRFPSSLVS